MALSDKEQRLLEQLEAALAAEDPKLASTLRGTTSRTLHRRRAAIAGLVFALGIGVLVGGMQIAWFVSVIGFVLMLAATVVAINAWRVVETASVEDDAEPAAFSDRSDDPWRRGDDPF
ncbi:MAG: DUF3040 domain-containing protein [Propionibacteriaceae bacterium]|nr:DUF3040 domain-containing protein [Propionibacteriaceae bacterium]